MTEPPEKEAPSESKPAGPPSQRPLIRVKKKKKKKRRSRWLRIVPVLAAAFLIHVFYIEATKPPEETYDDRHMYYWDQSDYPRFLDLALYRSKQKYGVTVEVDDELAQKEIGDTSIRSELEGRERPAEDTAGLDSYVLAGRGQEGETPVAGGSLLPIPKEFLDAAAAMSLTGDREDALRVIASAPLSGDERSRSVSTAAGYPEEELVARFESALRRATTGDPPIENIRSELDRLLADDKIVALGAALGLDTRELAHVLTEYLILSTSDRLGSGWLQPTPVEIVPQYQEKGSTYERREYEPVQLKPTDVRRR